MCLVRVHKTSTRTDFPLLSSLTPTTPVRRRYHTDNYLRDLGYCKRTRKRMLRAAQRGMLRVIIQTKEKIQKTRRKLEEKTFVMTKSARRLKKKSAPRRRRQVTESWQTPRPIWNTRIRMEFSSEMPLTMLWIIAILSQSC